MFCLFWDSSCSKSEVYLLLKNVWFLVFIKSSLPSYGDGSSSGNEADSEGEEACEKDVKEITDMMKCFTPYMFELDKDEVSSINSSSSEVEGEDKMIQNQKLTSRKIASWKSWMVQMWGV